MVTFHYVVEDFGAVIVAADGTGEMQYTCNK